MAVSIEQTGIQKVRARAWQDRLARKMVFAMMNQLQVGHLVFEEDGRTQCFGQPKSETDLVAHISIKHPSTYRQLVFNGTIGAGESYMSGGWETRNLLSVIQIFCRNQQALAAMQNRWTRIGGLFARIFHVFNANSLKGSRKNISAHYDLSNDFFKLFLDQTMMYSSAIYPYEGASLEDASINKLEHICQRLDLRPEDHLLEIGTGWGSMAIYAAQNYGCRVTTTTISKEQFDYAISAVKEAGLEDRIDVLFKDYRELQGSYDKLVSIEMIEAVGHKYYSEYFQHCSSLLKPDGLGLIQSITIADQRYKQYISSTDFIQRYIFPGGSLPSIQVISEQIAKYSDMQIVGLEDITLHYAETLKDWRTNFFDHIEKVRSLGFDDAFEKMWEYYLCYCEGGFRERMISTVQLMVAKPGRHTLPKLVRAT